MRVLMIMTLMLLAVPGLGIASDITVDLVSYGTYEGIIAGTEPCADCVDGYRNISGGSTLIEQTTTVPCVLGTDFGIEYLLHDTQGRTSLDLHFGVDHPTLLSPDTQAPFTRTQATWAEDTGKEETFTYTLETENEVVPGTWTFWIRDPATDELLIQKTFQCVEP